MSVFTSYRLDGELVHVIIYDREHSSVDIQASLRASIGLFLNLNALIGKKEMQRGPQFGRFEFHFINGKEPLRGT